MFKLSTDIIFKILNNLTIEETEILIDELKLIYTQNPNPRVREVIIFAYQRIYQGNFSIYSNLDKGVTSVFDKSFKIEDFESKINNNNKENSIESITFKNTRPKCIEFIFIRQPTDYHQFVKDLNQFNEMFSTKDQTLITYMKSVLQYGIYINGNSVLVEPTTSFLVSILKVLICISNNDPNNHLFCEKLISLTIKSTDIGQYYINQWCRLFSRFSNLRQLDLSDDLIKSDTFYDEEVRDILGNYFQWPPNLTYLNLDSNFVTYISKNFLEKLPSTLETLRLANNWLSTIGINDDETYNIPSMLPNLTELILDDNNRLTKINPEVFSSNIRFSTLSVKGCDLTNENLRLMTETAKHNHFVIII